MAEHDEKFQSYYRKIRDCIDDLAKHQKLIDVLNDFKDQQLKTNERAEDRIKKNKVQAWEDTVRSKDELNNRIDDIERNQSDYMTNNDIKHSEQRACLRNEIDKLRDEAATSLKTELSTLKEFVTQATDKVNSNNDGIYEQYEGKLKKIKDVCAQYFSKYEKHLINHQTIVKDLEKQQDQWVKMLIKPQELNQARLYTIETRI